MENSLTLFASNTPLLCSGNFFENQTFGFRPTLHFRGVQKKFFSLIGASFSGLTGATLCGLGGLVIEMSIKGLQSAYHYLTNYNKNDSHPTLAKQVDPNLIQILLELSKNDFSEKDKKRIYYASNMLTFKPTGQHKENLLPSKNNDEILSQLKN